MQQSLLAEVACSAFGRADEALTACDRVFDQAASFAYVKNSYRGRSDADAVAYRARISARAGAR